MKRVIIEVEGGCVTEVHGDVEYVLCDWDNISGGDEFELPEGWKDDPDLSSFSYS